MSIHTEIDQALQTLGTVEPPFGLEERIHMGLRPGPRRFPRTVFYGISGGALAASIALSGVALQPSLHRLLFSQHGPAQNLGPARSVPANGGFGAAGAVRVPVEPIPVQPTPGNQGRGRSRSGRATLPTASVPPLPRGVTPTQPAR